MTWPEAIYASVCVIGMVAMFVLFILCDNRRAKR